MRDLLPYLVPFVATVSIETGIASLSPRWRIRRLILMVLFANCLTHPVAFTLYEQDVLTWLPLEILVTATETLVYARLAPMPLPTALRMGVLTNAVTAGLAWILRYF